MPFVSKLAGRSRETGIAQAPWFPYRCAAFTLAANRLCDDCICRHQVLFPGVILLPHSQWYLHIEWGARETLAALFLIYICSLVLEVEGSIIWACSPLTSLSLYSLVLKHHGLLQPLQGSGHYLVTVTGGDCYHAVPNYSYNLHKPRRCQICHLHSHRLCWPFRSNPGQHRHSHSMCPSLRSEWKLLESRIRQHKQGLPHQEQRSKCPELGPEQPVHRCVSEQCPS